MCGITGWAAFGRDLRTAVPAVRRPWWRTRGPPAGPVRAPGVRRRARAGLGRAQAGHRTRPAPRRPGSAYQGPDSEVHASAEHVGVVLVVGVQVRQRTAAGGFVLNGGGAPRPGGEARRCVVLLVDASSWLLVGGRSWPSRHLSPGCSTVWTIAQCAEHGAVEPGHLRAGVGAAQHGDFVPQREDLGVFGGVGAGEQRQPGQHANEHQVGKSEGHAERSCWGGAGR